ncbi:hypothetical protein GIB67_018642 [Kingdonia uniflora]|uniref:CONSTANS-like protein n=1 Tax=Kingdonia uniflora TaxID=39325 RepID=A0A7J7M2Q9_9MAGN|nr:hypothetical protein GIB67_018642 [Kingdonia uniflora]
MRVSDEISGKHFAASWNISAKPCDSCKSASALLFCRADSAYLCINCDSKVHCANKLASRHERVWMCEVCEQAPSSFTCKADAAALCVRCDNDIHAANPLARRHERVPVVPFYESAASALKSNVASLLVPEGIIKDDVDVDDDDEAEAASWLLPNPSKLMETTIHSHVHAHAHVDDLKSSADYFYSDVDPYLDLDYAAPIITRFHDHESCGAGADSVVPVQTDILVPNPLIDTIDFCRSAIKASHSFSYPTPSLSQSVSSSSHEVGVVPDGTMADISNPFVMNMTSGMDLIGTTTGATLNQATQLCGLDREARVLRYREKRKNRKFEKTIRYASRKAYAETRPRIKGRFAKRTEIEVEVDRIYSSASALLADTGGYGIVPSF